MTPAQTIEHLKDKFGAESFSTSEFRDNVRVHVADGQIFAFLECLKSQCGFDMLVDMTAVDYLNYPAAAKDRFAVVYCLLNSVDGQRFYAKTFVNDPDPQVPSCTALWKGADWMEREIFDMYGIRFPGHPDLRRILMPEEFTSHPLRKDYPLRGRGERHNFPVITRAEG